MDRSSLGVSSSYWKTAPSNKLDNVAISKMIGDCTAADWILVCYSLCRCLEFEYFVVKLH